MKSKILVQFGEGGAGTFSDGKLLTRISDPLCGYILRMFRAFGAPEEILYLAKPHIGTDKLRLVVKNMRKEIERLGGSCKTSFFAVCSGYVKSLIGQSNRTLFLSLHLCVPGLLRFCPGPVRDSLPDFLHIACLPVLPCCKHICKGTGGFQQRPHLCSG